MMVTASPASSTVWSQPSSFSMRPSCGARSSGRARPAAAGKAEGPHAAMARQDRAVHLLEEADACAGAVAGVPLAAPAGTSADVEILQHHRKAQFQHLRVGEPRIGHVGVHGVGAVEARAGRRAGADRLVILIGRVAEGEVVHRALRGGQRAERAEQAVSVTACDVSTLPATTAAGYSGDSIEPSG